MYTVSKGPSKIVAKSRRGVSQNYEKFETIKESSKKSSDYYSPEKISTPRPVFQTTKKSQFHTKQIEEEHISPQHEELVKYISDSWNMVVAQNPYDAATATATEIATAAINTNGTAAACTIPKSSSATTTATTVIASATLTNGHSVASDSNNNSCSNYMEKDITTTASLSAATLAVYTNGNGSSSIISGSNSSLSSISTVSSVCTSPTSPVPQSPILIPATLYCVEPPSPVLKDFKPFDLEAWWGRRLFNNITKTI